MWMISHGVKLEQQKKLSLKDSIMPVAAPPDLPERGMFKPLKKKISAEGVISAAQKACIIDESDGVPLSKKLSRLSGRKIDVLVAQCFDEDPFTSGAMAVLRENAERIAAGLELAALGCGAPEKAIAAASRKEAKKAAESGVKIKIITVGNRYPAGVILKQKLYKDGKRAAFIGAQACAALEIAVKSGKIQSKTVVTVAGDGVQRWANCRVSIGTPIKAVLDAGLACDTIAAVVTGSSIIGETVTDLSAPVKADTRCVIALKNLPKRRVFPCVGCDRCAKACPRGIVPWLILKEMETGEPNPLRLSHVQYCVGCAACSVVCPCGIDLLSAVRQAAKFKKSGDLYAAD